MAAVKSMFALMMMGVLLTVPMTALAGELTAGDVNDNLQFDYYLDYLAHTLQNNTDLPRLTVEDRVIIKVVDGDGLPVSHARVAITADGANSSLIESYTSSAGLFYFFPEHDGAGSEEKFTVVARPPEQKAVKAELKLDLGELGSKRTLVLKIPDYQTKKPLSLDIVFTIDVTGSMSDELKYLTSEFQSIIGDIAAGFPNVSMRFGLVVYRDHGDRFVIKSYGFTDSLQTMQDQLAEQKAEGGGDYEEAVDEALEAAVGFPWREGNTVRMLFHVGDAPPHDEKLSAALEPVEKARRQGVQMFTLAGSGVQDIAEYMMRAEALLTTGRYCFLTDDSGIGGSHEKPHICCYVVTLLDDLIYRIVASELAGYRIEPNETQIIRTVGNYTNGTCTEEECCGNGTAGSGSTTPTVTTPTFYGGGARTSESDSPPSSEVLRFSASPEPSHLLTAREDSESSDESSSSSPPASKERTSAHASFGMTGMAAGAAVALVICLKLLTVRDRRKKD
jgi:hypothetical protein